MTTRSRLPNAPNGPTTAFRQRRRSPPLTLLYTIHPILQLASKYQLGVLGVFGSQYHWCFPPNAPNKHRARVGWTSVDIHSQLAEAALHGMGTERWTHGHENSPDDIQAPCWRLMNSPW